jgi:hypothetical protein
MAIGTACAVGCMSAAVGLEWISTGVAVGSGGWTSPSRHVDTTTAESSTTCTSAWVTVEVRDDSETSGVAAARGVLGGTARGETLVGEREGGCFCSVSTRK